MRSAFIEATSRGVVIACGMLVLTAVIVSVAAMVGVVMNHSYSAIPF